LSSLNYQGHTIHSTPIAAAAVSTPPSILTAKYLRSSDPALKNLPTDKYSKPVGDDTLRKTVQSLESLGHKVSVCDTPADAMKILTGMIPDGASVGISGSITLEEIGFVDYLIKRKNIKNYRGLALERQAKNDIAGSTELRREAMSADYYFSSVSAIAQTGEIVGADASGTRVGGWVHATKRVVMVAGTNKIVPDYDAAVKRLREYQLPLESARVRIAFKVPQSTISNMVSIFRGVPKERIHIIFVKGSYGF